MATRCIVVDCLEINETAAPAPPGWALLKLSALEAGVLVTTAQGGICPKCRAKLPQLRTAADQVVAPDLEPAGAADDATPSPETLVAAPAGPETVEIGAADVGAVPDAIKDV